MTSKTYDEIIAKQPKGTRYCVNCKAYVKPMKLAGQRVCPNCERFPLLMTPTEAKAEGADSE